MRLHITLDDALVRDLDCIVGARERSSFIARAVRRAIDEHERSEALVAALGSISDSGHDWDTDPAAWVRAQRTGQQTPITTPIPSRRRGPSVLIHHQPAPAG